MSDQNSVVLPGNDRPTPEDATRVGDIAPDARVEVTLNLSGPPMPDADHLPDQPLTSEQFAARYGTPPDVIARVTQTLRGFGLTVEDASPATRSLRVSGTADQIRAAFPSDLAIYHSAAQGDFRGREGDIRIPAELSGMVTGVFGLDQRQVARRKAGVRTPRPKDVGAAGHPLAHVAHQLSPLGPADLEAHYAFPAGDAAGQRVGIAEFGGGYFPDDLAAFCQKHGRPQPQVDTVAVGLQPLTLAQIRQMPPGQQQQELGMTGEVMMDVQIVAGFCPAARISVYFATFDQKGWVDLMNRVLLDRPVALSVSWGLPEDDPGLSDAARAAIVDRLNAAALLGITVCVSSGDDGSGDQVTDGRAHVDFPASTPYVLAVGGTMLSGVPPHVVEKTWWQSPGLRTGHGGGSTGGGVSVLFRRPAWQDVRVASLNPGSPDGRVVPDVSALSGPPFYDLTLLGQDAPNGGTSASAPLWASLIARMTALLPAGGRQRFLTPLLYQNGADGQPRGRAGCADVTVGQNPSKPQPGVGYHAGPGYDAVTGWGVPNGAALLQALQQ